VHIVPFQQPRNPAVTARDFDVFANLGDAGAWRRRDFGLFPRHQGYLKPDPARVTAIRAEYRAVAGQKPLVGISWHSAAPSFGPDKTLTPAARTHLLELPGVQWVNLQYGPHAFEVPGEAALYDPNIDALRNMDDFAAQVAAMDLVVSVSNTTAPLAGALGKPAWVMLPRVKNRRWYWFPDQQPNPWYPSLRPFLQSADGSWDGVAAAVTAALGTL
jgi:hypothetical protein